MKNPVFRIDEILRWCKGKSVLHLGYVQHSHLYDGLIKEGNWVHANIAEVASELVGLDYLEKDVKIIREKYGYEGYFADATHLEDLKLDRTFDVIVCGELIEHITNPGAMLEGVKKFMHKDSVLLITTPNPWATDFIKKIKKKQDEINWVNPEHVSWYSYFTLKNTMERHAYQEVKYGYYYFFETEKKYYAVSRGLVGKLKTIKRKWLIARTPPQNQLGLFFAARKGA